MFRLTTPTWMLGACAAMMLSACGGGGTPEAAIGGSVSGLAADATVGLQENNSSVLSVSGSTAFEFPGTLPANAAYAVTVATQPPGETCSVSNGSGTPDSNGDPVSNVQVSCVPGTTVGGTVAGLAPGTTLVLSDGNTTLPVTAMGPFTFGDLYANGAAYNVSVLTQPAGQNCSVSNGSGNIDAIGDAVGNVAITCAAAPALSGTVAGLAPNASLTLGDGSSQQIVAANGSFAFADSYAPGAVYQVSVLAQPAGQTCTVSNDTGVFDSNGDPVGNVAVSCTTNGTVGGTVIGLATNAAVVLSDGSTTLNVGANGSFAFPDVFLPGAAYAVSVQGQPAGQTCSVVGGTDSGFLDANDDAVTSVSIVCS